MLVPMAGRHSSSSNRLSSLYPSFSDISPSSQSVGLLVHRFCNFMVALRSLKCVLYRCWVRSMLGYVRLLQWDLYLPYRLVLVN